jgi:hypothetical protein
MPRHPAESLPIQVGEIINPGKKTEAKATLHSTRHDFSELDEAIFDDSIVATYRYNEAFTKTGYTLGSFESVTNINVPVGWMPDYHL